ncbi:MAG: DUF359 domain-containing protein [Candidatus Bathyarchaeia archaeon]
MATLVLTETQRGLLKRPLGELISGTPTECNSKLMEIVAKEKPVRLILVGDTISRNAIQTGMKADVIIIDRMEKRQQAVEFNYTADNIFRTQNSAGTIESGAWKVIEEAVRRGNSIVNVDGEEDLLALPAVLSSPEKSIVVYGQPGEGIVLVRVSAQSKKQVSKFVEQMQKRN